MVYKRFYPVLKRSANRILAGQSCVMCGLDSVQSAICEVCTDAVSQKGHQCYQCGDAITSDIAEQRCGTCLKAAKPYQRLISACHYDFPINRAISRFKFEQQLHLGRALTELLTQRIDTAYRDKSLPSMIIPVPLHHKRLAERGFNQSVLIATQLSQKLSIPINGKQLIRIKNTPHQIGLKAVERRKNLKDAFTIKHTLPEHIVLVDDVVTTGTTIAEASKTCLKHGAKRIDIWCLAKT